MEFARTLIEGFLNLLAAVGALLLVGLATLALIRAAPIVLPAAARFALLLGELVGEIMRQVFAFLTMFARPILYVIMVGCVVLAIIVTLPAIYQAYGEDAPALLPAIAVCLLPIVISLGSGRGWWTLFGAAAQIYGAGAIIQAADLLARGAILSTVIASIVAYEILNRERMNDEKNTVVDHAGRAETGAAVVHGKPHA